MRRDDARSVATAEFWTILVAIRSRRGQSTATPTKVASGANARNIEGRILTGSLVAAAKIAIVNASRGNAHSHRSHPSHFLHVFGNA